MLPECSLAPCRAIHLRSTWHAIIAEQLPPQSALSAPEIGSMVASFWRFKRLGIAFASADSRHAWANKCKHARTVRHPKVMTLVFIFAHGFAR
jgi:hypothetical protein